jgi:hypothetical protein
MYVRRLDNERTYLKSQLASEITHKNEMQTALIHAQQQLSDVQQQWTRDGKMDGLNSYIHTKLIYT